MKGTVWASSQVNITSRLLRPHRYIINETVPANKPLATDMPNLEKDLPFEMDLSERSCSTQNDLLSRQSVSAFGSDTIGCFGREVQAAYLYKRVLEIIQIRDTTAALLEFPRMDVTLREFFQSIMCLCRSTWGLYCGAITFTIG